MLDQVIVSRTILYDPFDKIAHHAQLMVAGKVGDALTIALHVLDEVVDYV